jgi:hypothetical protein
MRSSRRRLLPQRDHYRAGRVLAGFFRVVGWLMVAAGFAALPIVTVLGLARQFGLPTVAGGGAGLIGLGLLIVLFGQMARALFDQANATRELLAIERARNGAEGH